MMKRVRTTLQHTGGIRVNEILTPYSVTWNRNAAS